MGRWYIRPMPLAPATRLGPYEILAPLGAGGMGEVYRARDTRLGREVAIKTLPAAFAQDAERRARFETEAKAIAALSHPNVLAIHDVGAEGDTVFAVMELVEGQTLREMLQGGGFSASRAVSVAVQIANGLAAAHDRGIIHRDLKPENVVVTPDGRAKILDFGLARRTEETGAGSQSMAPTLAATEPGVVLGTVGYMSPEQVRGQSADARSDIFALGAVLYEMLSGRRAFHADSPAETMSAILREDPPDLAPIARDVPPAIDRVVRRCLEKHPTGRFRSAADLAFALEAVSGSGASAPAAASSPGAPTEGGATAPTVPSFRRLTFRNGHVAGARFTPDGASIVYGAAWDGRPHEIFTSRIGSPESRGLGLPAGNLLAMSAAGEMAVSLGYHHPFWLQVTGTLARVALAGGGVRPLQKDVGHADWSPDGRSMAMIRYKDGHCLLEYPPGNVLVDVEEWLGYCRVSPDGRHVAFSRHHRSGEGEGDLCVVDASGSCRVLVPGTTNLNGIVWSPEGDRVWWSGISASQLHGIWSVGLDGSQRQVYVSPVRVRLLDVRRDGTALVSIDDLHTCLSIGSGDGDAPESEMSWFDGSVATDFTADGSQVLFIEVAEAENPHYACYLRQLDDGSAAVRLGSGNVSRLSADGQWVVSVVTHPAHELMLYPTGFGEARAVPFLALERVWWAGFHPDGGRLFVVASSPDRPRRLYEIAIAGGAPRLLWDEEVDFDRFVGLPISPDGDRVVLRRNTGEYVSYSVRANAVEPMKGLGPGQTPIRFDASGRSLYVTSGDARAREIHRLDLATGERTPWRTLRPPHPMGVLYMSKPIVSSDARRYAYSFMRVVSNLYLVEGLC